MKIYTHKEVADSYIKLSNATETIIIPLEHYVEVDDESGFKSIKNTGTRKTIGLLKV